MQTTRRVDVMITRKPSLFCRIDPPFEVASQGLRNSILNPDPLVPDQVFWASREFNQVFSPREYYFLSV